MSKMLDMADLIRTRFLTAPTATEIPTPVDLTVLEDSIIVDRQKDLLPAIKLSVAKAKGTAISILWGGWTVADENAGTPRLAHRFTVTVWSKPIISGDNLAADDVIEAAVNRLWHWIPGGGHCNKEAKPTNGGLVPHKSFVIYDIEVVLPISH